MITSDLPLFFSEDVEREIVTLSAEESRHCAKVLRKKAGDEIFLTNGKGVLSTGVLLDVHSARTNVTIVSRQTLKNQRSFYLHMIVAPTKSMDRFEWFVEKATEIGVDEITPVVCAQSERNIVKTERLKRIIISALKQSQRTFMPKVNPVITYSALMEKDFSDSCYIAHCLEGEKVYLSDDYQKRSNATVLIGPEGDFNQSEIDMALGKGFLAISLGENRLRTETAALLSCIELNLINR
ncbi:MAG: 16S rRNA (uracil(1498)-N(3))-methyltransferase [Bacteroidales bacterium]